MTQTPEQVQALADAMWQLLDDMGEHGLNVCLAAKAQARLAFEPFKDDDWADWMTVEQARVVLRESDQ